MQILKSTYSPTALYNNVNRKQRPNCTSSTVHIWGSSMTKGSHKIMTATHPTELISLIQTWQWYISPLSFGDHTLLGPANARDIYIFLKRKFRDSSQCSRIRFQFAEYIQINVQITHWFHGWSYHNGPCTLLANQPFFQATEASNGLHDCNRFFGSMLCSGFTVA